MSATRKTKPDTSGPREADCVPVYNATNGNNNWATPRAFLAEALIALDLPPVAIDLAATRATAVVPIYFGPDHAQNERRDALARRARWDLDGARGTRYLNPPYGRLCTDCPDKVWKGKPSGLPREEWCERKRHTSSTVLDWMRRVAGECRMGLDPLLVLVPARTDTAWWHECVHGHASRVVLIEGRLRFLDESLEPAEVGPAPFPSTLIEYMPPPAAGHWVTQYCTLTSEGKPGQLVDRVWKAID